MVDRLAELRSLRTDIRIAIAGIGSIGNGLCFQSTLTPGLRTVAIADTRIERAIGCAEWLGLRSEVVRELGPMHDAIRRGRLAVCHDAMLAAQCENRGGCVDATSSVLAGGKHALTALHYGRYVAMMDH